MQSRGRVHCFGHADLGATRDRMTVPAAAVGASVFGSAPSNATHRATSTPSSRRSITTFVVQPATLPVACAIPARKKRTASPGGRRVALQTTNGIHACIIVWYIGYIHPMDLVLLLC